MRTVLIILMVFALASTANAEQFVSKYLSSKPIILIKDKHAQAKAWATCAEIYDALGNFYAAANKAPETVKQLRNMANGAEVAVAMTFVSRMLAESDISPSTIRFNATWTMAKMAMKETPSAVQTTINAALERNGAAEMDEIIKAGGICTQNVEDQQTMINLWRELAASGLLKFPK